MKAKDSKRHPSPWLVLALAGAIAGSAAELEAQPLEPAGASEYLERIITADALPPDAAYDPSDPASLSYDRVGSIRQDLLGFLWVATEDGLFVFDPETGGFQVFRHRPGDATSLSDSRVRALAVDRAGELWVGTEAGLDRFHRPTRTFERFDLGVSDLPVGRTPVGRTPVGRTPVGRTPVGRTPVHAILEDRRGALWIGTSGGLLRLDRATGSVRRFVHPPDTPHSLAGDDVRALWEDRSGILWIGTRGGLAKLGGPTRFGSAGERDEPRAPPWVLTAVRSFDRDRELGVVAPPWWRTAWFRLAVGLAVLAAGGLGYRLRIGQLTRRERELAGRVEEGLEGRRRSDQRYRLLFERNLAGVVRATVDGRILDGNHAFARLLGFASVEACLGQRMLAGEGSAGFVKKLREEGQVVSYEYSLEARDGSEVPLLWNAHLLVEEGGELVIEGTVIDISERRRMEEGLLRSQKLESLALLAGGIAHDFNNLLTAVLGHAELARNDLPPLSRARGRLDQIEQAAERAASLSKQMLAYSGKGSFVVEAIDLTAAVDEMAALLEGTIADRVALTYDLARDLPAVEADRSQLSQVLVSLLTNATEAIGEGETGTVTVRTGAMSCDRAYLAETFLDEQLDEGDYVFLEVRDTGCGMDVETQLRIFDPFFTTKFTGRGLGLAAVLGIVRGHRGAIEVESEPGEGTAIRVLLPASGFPAAAPAARPAEDESWHGHGKLLLVDDEEQVRMVGEEMAKLLGFEVLTAADGRRGVEVFRRHADELALVVLDLAMPRMDGAETFREMQRIRSDVPVLLATGYDEQETKAKLGDRGFAGFIQKPYRLSVLRRKLRRALGAAAGPLVRAKAS